MLLIIIISVLAVIQSLFGVGLLVFGTPTLLLIGYPFADALAILLPASIAISVLQVWKSRRQDLNFDRASVLWCLIPLGITLAALLAFDRHAHLNLFVAILLAVFVTLRLYPKVNERARAVVARHERAWMVLMGVVHGVSNLGGALLLIFAASRYREKEDVRAVVSFFYTCFAAVQLMVLAIVTPEVFAWAHLGYAALAGTVFLLVGQRIFKWIEAPAFERLLTGFAGAYAVLLGLRAAGLV